MKNEKDVYQAFKKWLLENHPGAFIGRIENSVEPGWCDCLVQVPKYPRAIFIEFKYARSWNEVLRPKFRPGQISFAKRWESAKGEWRCVVGFSSELSFICEPKPRYNDSEIYRVAEAYFFAGCES